MIDELQAWMTWASVEVARAGLFAWLLGRGNDADDEDVVECHEFVLSAMSDADQARTIKTLTGKDIRNMSVQEAQALHEEMELRKMGGNRN